MDDALRSHYERHPYPWYPLIASVRRRDTYALNLTALWARFNGRLPGDSERSVLVAGCGSFSPYVFSLANPDCRVTALDLSAATLRRARLHCLLHGQTGVDFQSGNLLDSSRSPGPFGLIDAYGVIHHLENPLQGLRALKGRLAPGGILRLMVYSRHARREEESIRRAFRLLKVRDLAAARRLLGAARPGSRLRRFADDSWEAGFDSGVADALLHPQVKTFRIDELLELVDGAGLETVLFAHPGACDDIGSEIKRLREMEQLRTSPGNFVLYLRRTGAPAPAGRPLLLLNPCLAGEVGRLKIGTTEIMPRLGRDNPPLDAASRRELRPFLRPLPAERSTLSPERRQSYLRALFLVGCHP